MGSRIKRAGRYVMGVLVLGLVAVLAINFWADHRVLGDFYDSDGVKIHFTDEGQGEPVILIHGFAANADLNWRHWGVNKMLSKHYRVIALDNRGHGLSDKPVADGSYGMNMVDDVIRLMDHLDIEQAHIVGYSMGGFLTMKLVTEYPDRVISAMPCGAGWPRTDEESSARVDAIASSLEETGSFAPLLEYLTPLDEELSPFKIKSTDKVLQRKADPAIMAKAMRGMLEFAVDEAKLRANKIPIKTIVGSIDPIRESVEPLEGVLANFEVVYLPEGDHLSTLRMPEFLEEIEVFIDAHRLSGVEIVADAA